MRFNYCHSASSGLSVSIMWVINACHLSLGWNASAEATNGSLLASSWPTYQRKEVSGDHIKCNKPLPSLSNSSGLRIVSPHSILWLSSPCRTFILAKAIGQWLLVRTIRIFEPPIFCHRKHILKQWTTPCARVAGIITSTGKTVARSVETSGRVVLTCGSAAASGKVFDKIF